MNRAQRRKAGIKGRMPTYNTSLAQVRIATRQEAIRATQDIQKDITRQSLMMMLVFPCYVLMADYWPKTYRQKLPEFCSKVVQYYAAWDRGEIDIEQLQADLWELGGVRFEEEDGDRWKT